MLKKLGDRMLGRKAQKAATPTPTAQQLARQHELDRKNRAFKAGGGDANVTVPKREVGPNGGLFAGSGSRAAEIPIDTTPIIANRETTVQFADEHTVHEPEHDEAWVRVNKQIEALRQAKVPRAATLSALTDPHAAPRRSSLKRTSTVDGSPLPRSPQPPTEEALASSASAAKPE